MQGFVLHPLQQANRPQVSGRTLKYAAWLELSLTFSLKNLRFYILSNFTYYSDF